MSGRELVVLGTSAQVPTRHRNHNGYLLRFDGEGVLFDPGEGTQRQLLLAGVPVGAVTRICITHFHGDHCLGLPGVLQRMSLDRVPHPVAVCYPASGSDHFDRLRRASIFEEAVDLAEQPVTGAGLVDPGPPLAVVAGRLDHRVECFGWRLEEPAGRRMLPERLAALGVSGPAVGRLAEEGSIEVAGRRVTLAEVSEERRGQSFALVMDTRLCEAAFELARGVDLLVCESTFLSSEAGLAEAYGHLTAAQAARIAAEAGARRLVLSHFSQRHPDVEAFLDEARPIFPEVEAATDLARFALPGRR